MEREKLIKKICEDVITLKEDLIQLNGEMKLSIKVDQLTHYSLGGYNPAYGLPKPSFHSYTLKGELWCGGVLIEEEA